MDHKDHIVAVIPARYASTRFPGKPLAAKTGKPLIQHVVEAARLVASLDRVIVATDDHRIEQAVRDFGGEVVMTREDHPNGTSRIAEAIDSLYGQAHEPQIVVNVQGDEPEIEPHVIEALIAALRDDHDAPMATLASPFAPGEDVANPNVVKLVRDARGRAMYFSRSVIPFDRDGKRDARSGHISHSSASMPYFKHPGLYAYRRDFLNQYASLTPTPLEQAEQLEQLRVLEHGLPIATAVVSVNHVGIDTPEQYEAFVARYRQNLA